ncbi:MAG TPA: SMP-30/gluconolactonase/LRE family protein, partial [Paenibacillus sp.]|nr:SMP-30/gluconolactonase/LRE family protein [Paenibacillus sp.]
EEWLVAAEDGYYFWTPGTNVLTSIHALDGMRASQRFNDGKCDPLGRFWAGTMEREGGAPTGALYCLDAAGRSRRIVEGLGCSNGMAWSADGRTMYFIDSPTREVRAYDFALESGEISNPRAVVRIPDGEGVPDGMTIDEEGMLWVAQWGGYQVSRWDPSTGERIGSVRVPAERVTSCAFGGPNLDTLYITTASIGASQEQAIAEPTAGGLFAAKPGMRGFAAVPAALAGK